MRFPSKLDRTPARCSVSITMMYKWYELCSSPDSIRHSTLQYINSVACVQKGGKPEGDLIPVTCYTWEAPRVGE